jgi:hypothetical protein
MTCDDFNSEKPSMTYSGSFAWEETKDGNYEIYWRRWFSASPDAEARVSNNGAESRLPSISGELNHIVAWQDLRDGNWEIYSRKLSPLGPETRVSFDSGSSTHPSLWQAEVQCTDIIFSKNFVAWQDDQFGNERILQSEGESGSWFSWGTLASQMPGPSIHPSYMIELEPYFDEFGGGYFYYCNRPVIAWEEHSLNALPKIFLSKDFGSGTEEIPLGAWPSDPILVTWTSGPERNLEVIWTEKIDGNPEIYHASLVETFWNTDAPEPNSTVSVQLGSPRPNPFRQSTQFSVRIEQPGPLTVGIYDTAGRLVQELHEGWSAAGVNEFTWQQIGVAAGTYHVRVATPDGSATQKVQLIR